MAKETFKEVANHEIHPSTTTKMNVLLLPCLSRRQHKMGLLVFSLLYIPLFAGAFFGFGPMQIMLEESGAFASLCEYDDDNYNVTTTTSTDTYTEVCPAQTAKLLTM